MLAGALQLGTAGGAENGRPDLSLDGYELLEEIARGGMGVVYRARQIPLNRIVAVKFILIGEFANSAAVRRFQAEAAAAAKLRHPNITAIYEIGEQSGRPYFSMEYVDGQNLAEFMRLQPISIRQSAHLVKKVADAVDYAHRQGIVHRDLKPSNILVDALLEPRITDFGLARDLGAESDLTLTGQVLGSPNYISPEQARGQAAGTAADLYSLGAILYQLLAGRPPFAAETLTETLKQVVENDPVAPRLLNPSLPRDLETICLKCLEKEPAQRYRSASEVSDELARFLNDEPIRARPIRPPAKAWRWCRRKPVMASLILSCLLSVILGVGGIVWQWLRAEQKAEESRHHLYAADMIRAQGAIELGSLGFALDLLRKYLPAPGEKDLRGWEWHYAWNRCQSDELFSFGPFGFPIFSVAISKDGSLLAAGGAGPVTLWDVKTREKANQKGFRETVPALTFSRDQKEIIGGTSDGRLIVWNLETGQTNTVLTNLSGTRSLALSPDGNLLALYTHRGLSLWKLPNYQQAATFPSTSGSDNLPGGIAFSPDSRVLAYSREGGEIILWDIARASEIAAFQGHQQNVTGLAFFRDSLTLVSGSRDRTIRLWEVKSGKELQKIEGFSAFVTALCLSPDNRFLAVVGGGQHLRLFETGSWEEINTLKGHTSVSRSVIFSPDGRTLFTAGKDGTVKGWPVSTNPRLFSQGLPGTAQILPGAKGLCIDFTNQTFSFWRSDPLQEISPIRFPFEHSQAKNVSPGGRLRVAATESGVNLFDHRTGRSMTNISLSSTGGRALNFSADGGLLAIRGYDNTCQVWRIDPPESPRALLSRVASLKLKSDNPWSVRFSPRGRLLGVAQEHPNIVEIWDLESQTKVELALENFWPTDLAISRDESLVAVTSGGGELVVCDLRTRRPIARRGGQLGTSWSVDFSPDDTRIAACGGDGIVRIWDRKSFQEVAVLKLHEERLWQLAFSETGETLFVLGQDTFGRHRLFTLRAPKLSAPGRL